MKFYLEKLSILSNFSLRKNKSVKLNNAQLLFSFFLLLVCKQFKTFNKFWAKHTKTQSCMNLVFQLRNDIHSRKSKINDYYHYYSEHWYRDLILSFEVVIYVNILVFLNLNSEIIIIIIIDFLNASLNWIS